MATDQPPNQPSPPDGPQEQVPAPEAHGASAAPPPPPYGRPPGEYEAPPAGYQQAPPPGAYQQVPPSSFQQQGPPPGAYPQGYPQGYPQAPAPYYGWPEPKSRLAAGLLGIFLGGMGIHRFYLGYVTLGVVQLLVTVFTFGFGAIWGFVEGIMILAGAQSFRADARGVPLRE